MKKKSIIIIALVSFVLLCGIGVFIYFLTKTDTNEFNNNLFVDGLVLVEKDGKYGYLNQIGEVVIDFLYDGAESFYNDVAIVKVSGKYFLINKDGKPINNQKYDNLKFDHKGGLYIFMRNTKYGLLSLDGTILLDAIYDDIGYFSEGVAIVKNGNKYGFIDKKGKQIVECKYNFAFSFSDGYASVVIDNKFGYINKKGELVIAALYDYAGPFHDGYAIVLIETAKGPNCKVIDKNGKTIHSDYELIARTKNCFITKKEDAYYIINKNGDKTFLSTKYENIYVDTTLVNHYLEYFYAEDEDTFYILDEQGKVVFEATNNGNEVWYLFDIDISTRNIWFAEYKGNNLTIKTTNGKTLEYEYSESVPELFVENEKIILRKHNKFGVIDFNGTTLIGFNFDTITVTSDGYAIVEVNDKYGVVDLEGNTIIPILYDNIPYRNIPYWGLE